MEDGREEPLEGVRMRSEERGSKHEECTVCGYQKAAVEIPATGEPQVPGTGVDSQATLWLALLAASVAVTGVALGLRRKQAK